MKKTVLLIFLMFGLSAFSQQITGTVTDQSGLPLPGVNVNVASGASAVTDFNGQFTLDAAVGEAITLTMIGYKTLVLPADAIMNITMTDEVNELNEVVVVGYGTKRVGSITGSVSLIKSDEILKTPAQSAIQSIQGKAAGVNIVTNDEPGGNPTIRIRGLGTVLAARDPLYVIDGVEITTLNGTSPINGLSANDIESMNILKDASSLAIYGQKGANGVVLITTKRGKKGAVKVSYDGYYGQKHIQRTVKMADSYRYSYYNNIAKGSSTYYNLNSQPYNTNWLEEITQTGEVMNNSLSISNASESGNYYFGVSHYKEEAILKGMQFKRTNIINKNEYNLAGQWLKVRNFVNLSLSNKVNKPIGAFTTAYKQAPIMPVQYPNGRWGVPLLNLATGQNDLNGTDYVRYNNVGNPVAQLANTNEQSRYATLSGSVGIDMKLYKDLILTSNFGGTADWTREYIYTPLANIWLTNNILYENRLSTLADYEASFGNEPVRYNKLEQKRSNFYNWNWDNYLTYKKQFGKHDLTLVAGTSRTTTDNFEYLNAMRFNVPEKPNYWYLDYSTYNFESTVYPDQIRNEKNTELVSLSYFGRVEYEYDNRYLFSASIRREGLSSFSEDRRWGTFPSVSAGWVISNEGFMEGIKFVDHLKLRVGYGEVGNGNGPRFSGAAFTPGKNYNFNGVIYTGAYKDSQPDQNLTWETVSEIDFGIDFALLSNRLSGTFDYYDRRSEDIILYLDPPPVLSEQGIFSNAGEVTNKGFEAALRWQDNINENLRYWIGGNFSHNKNLVSSTNSPFFKNLPDSGSLGNGQNTKRVVVGQPLGSFYVLEQIGYDSDGKPRYNDLVDGVPGLDPQTDRIFAGSYLPTYTYGVNLGVSYRNVDFSVDAYGVGGNKIYNGKKAQRFDGENVEYDILDSVWTPQNPTAENPKPFNDVPLPSTYYVEDGAFLRINNITLGYTLPKMFDRLEKVRLYLTAINPFLFTEYSGYSPEVSGSDKGDPLRSAGIELDAYPTNKTYLIGANINF